LPLWKEVLINSYFIPLVVSGVVCERLSSLVLHQHPCCCFCSEYYIGGKERLQMKHFLAPIPLFADQKAKVALNRCFDYNQQSVCSRYTTNKFSREIFLYFLYKNNTLTFALEIWENWLFKFFFAYFNKLWKFFGRKT